MRVESEGGGLHAGKAIFATSGGKWRKKAGD
jgi:hypothetical protein